MSKRNENIKVVIINVNVKVNVIQMRECTNTKKRKVWAFN